MTGGPAPVAVGDAGIGPFPRPGRVDDLLPGLVRVTAPNPGMMTGPGTNTYLVGEGDVAVVDPGPDHAGHRGAVLAAAAGRAARVRWVLVTHTHPDHAPGAAALAAATGAEVVGFDARDGFSPDRRAGDGWTLGLGDRRLRAVHTPGHAANHLCWLVEPEGVLLTGDHVMHGSTVVIRPPDGDMGSYLASLQRVLSLAPPVVTIAPGHGRLVGDPPGTVRDLVAHCLQRGERVAAALSAAGRATVDQLLPTVYADVPEDRLPVARYSLWAHLRLLAAEGRAAPSAGEDGQGDDDPEAELRATWEATTSTAP